MGLESAFDRARANYATQPVSFPESAGIPERVRVRDSQERFQAALNAACDELSLEEMTRALRSPVPYVRHLAVKSLARRGDAGQQVAVAGLSDADWRVRSASCDVLVAPVEDAVLARLTELVADENAWVRCRAAMALGVVGRPDAAAATALVKAAQDDDEWVRGAALGALQKVGSDPKLIVAAVTTALRASNTTFAAVGRSVGLIEKFEMDDPALVPALVAAVENPGQGAGADRLKSLFEQLVRLDPEGKQAVPALSRMAAGGPAYDRMRGNPRVRAIELLGEYGERAASAKPVLEQIVAGTAEKEQAVREAARTALEKIAAKE